MVSGASSPNGIQLGGCFNFRDLGGLTTASGTSIRERMLFRSDALVRLDRIDQRQLSDIGMRTIIDLRTPKEVDRQGMCSWYEREPETYAMPLVAWETLPTRSQSEGWRTPEPMIDAYRAMFAEGSEMIAAVLTRTAIVVAVLLGILGVPRRSRILRRLRRVDRAGCRGRPDPAVTHGRWLTSAPCATVAGQ